MKRGSKLEIRNSKQIRNPKSGRMCTFGFRTSSFGVRILALVLAFVACPAFAATNISAGDDELAKLRPPRVEIPPTVWERYNIWIIAGSLVFLALIGIIVW